MCHARPLSPMHSFSLPLIKFPENRFSSGFFLYKSIPVGFHPELKGASAVVRIVIPFVRELWDQNPFVCSLSVVGLVVPDWPFLCCPPRNVKEGKKDRKDQKQWKILESNLLEQIIFCRFFTRSLSWVIIFGTSRPVNFNDNYSSLLSSLFLSLCFVGGDHSAEFNCGPDPRMTRLRSLGHLFTFLQLRQR